MDQGAYVVAIRLAIEQLAACLHNYDVHQQEGHKRRAKAALARLYQFRAIGQDTALPESHRFAAQFAYLRKVEPLLFEEMVLEAFRQRKFMVRFNERYSGDGGIDGRIWVEDWRQIDPYFARRYPDRIVRGWAGLQCKRYQGAVRQEHIRQFPEDMAREGLVAGFFVHTGTTPKARNPQPDDFTESANLPPVKRISGKALLHLLSEK